MSQIERLIGRFEVAFVASIHKVSCGGAVGPTGPFESLVREQPTAQRIPLTFFLQMSLDHLFNGKFGEFMDEYRVRGCGLPSCDRVDSLKRCAACGIVGYCCKDHQRAHWKQHKSKCRAVLITRNNKLHREWVAETAINFWRGPQVQFQMRNILRGGAKQTQAEMRAFHEITLQQILKNDERVKRGKMNQMKSSSVDPNADHPCRTPVESLKRITVRDLRAGNVHKDKALWVQVAVPFYKVKK